MLNNLKIGVRLALGFGIVLLMLSAVSYVGVNSMGKMEESTMHIVERNVARSQMATQIDQEINKIYIAMGNMLVLDSREKMLEEKKTIEDARANYKSLLDKIAEAETSQEGKDLVKKLDDTVGDARDVNNNVIAMCLSGKQDDAHGLYLTKAEPQSDKINAAVDDLLKYEQGRVKVRYDEAQKTYHDSYKLLVGIAILAIIAVIVMSFLLSRGIVKPLEEGIRVANIVASGDLTVSVSRKSKDEVGMLCDAINKMVAGIKETVDKVNQSAAQVAASADQVNSGAQNISKGAQTQASAAEETSSSMEEMAASIQTVAKNADALASNVEETSASINQMVASIEQVAKNSEAMASSVSETSATVEQMTASIEKVASDTEALSASVEETSATIEQMVASIDQVAKNSDMLASTVSETSSTIEEMAASINQVARNVSEADKLSQRAADEAKAGGEAVELTIEGISRISDTMTVVSKVIGNLGKRSEEIGKIVEVIEDIADQTNLLALNAAIEAARAGEAGRGFAVVADEVRKLAERSVVATKEIGEVIKQVQNETVQAVKSTEMGAADTQEGKKLADKAGAALKRILDSVGSTNHIMSEIANATAQQTSAASQVLKAVENMNQATDQVIGAVREQAMGSAQIRKAVVNMNGVTQQVAGAMKEQAAGGRQIRLAVEDMNRVTAQVSTASKEQASGSAQIMRAVDNMNNMTQQVAGATSEQKRGGELVVKAVENISDIARSNLAEVTQMVKAAEDMAFQAESMQQAISMFKTREINTNCWDILHCKEEFRYKCPAYQNVEKRCWLVPATWCKGVQQGDAKSKLRNCMHCEAFKVMQGVSYMPTASGKGSFGSDKRV